LPAPPRRFVALGARLATARTASHLRRPRIAIRQQSKAFAGLTERLSAAAFWAEDGVERRMSYEQFRSRIPVRTYEELAPAVERMKLGEAGVLWPGRCSNYAVSSGTTAGRTKYIPVTAEMLTHFRQTGLASLLYYTSRVKSAEVFRGRQLFLGGSTRLAPIAGSTAFPALAGDLSGITALHLPAWVEKHLFEPGAEIAQMSDWPAKIEAIVQRTLYKDITLLAGIPSWVLILAEALLAADKRTIRKPVHLQQIWPRFECLIHGGVPIGPYLQDLRKAMGPTVQFHEVYPASEAFIAAQDAEPEAGLRLMTDAGVFFEFLPMAEFDETRLPSLGGGAVPLDGVQTGTDYALLLTTPGGLCRYLIGDTVRFVSAEPPRLAYSGRTRLQLSAFGEHVIEKELTDALVATSARSGGSITSFHVAPLFVDASAGRQRGCHEWWIELRSGSDSANLNAASLAAGLDAELQRRNEDYEAKRRGNGLGQPVVRLAPPGTFEQWMRARGKWGGQSKMPRCRSDREVADALAELTRLSPFCPAKDQAAKRYGMGDADQPCPEKQDLG
jgi:hypothetical protein